MPKPMTAAQVQSFANACRISLDELKRQQEIVQRLDLETLKPIDRASVAVFLPWITATISNFIGQAANLEGTAAIMRAGGDSGMWRPEDGDAVGMQEMAADMATTARQCLRVGGVLRRRWERMVIEAGGVVEPNA